MSKKRKKQTCVYCGIRPAVKREHVVAQVFFDKPLPTQMLTVPSCDACDSGRGDGGDCDFHVDEDYMAKVLCTRLNADRHPVVKKKLLDGTVARTYARNSDLRTALFAKSQTVMLPTISGIYAPHRTMNVNLNKIRRVCRKIVRGLHYGNFKETIPRNANIDVWPDLPQQQFNQFLTLFKNPWFGWNNAVFLYRFAKITDHPGMSAWLMVFYDYFAVVALVQPTPKTGH